MTGEPLGSPVDDGYDGGRVGVAVFVQFDEGADGGVEPSACFDVVESGDDALEGFVEFEGFVLDFPVVVLDVHPGTAAVDECGGNFGFGGSDVVLSK